MSNVIRRDFKVTEVRTSEDSVSVSLTAEGGGAVICMDTCTPDAAALFTLGRIMTVEFSEALK